MRGSAVTPSGVVHTPASSRNTTPLRSAGQSYGTKPLPPARFAAAEHATSAGVRRNVDEMFGNRGGVGGSSGAGVAGGAPRGGVASSGGLRRTTVMPSGRRPPSPSASPRGDQPPAPTAPVSFPSHPRHHVVNAGTIDGHHRDTEHHPHLNPGGFTGTHPLADTDAALAAERRRVELFLREQAQWEQRQQQQLRTAAGRTQQQARNEPSYPTQQATMGAASHPLSAAHGPPSRVSTVIRSLETAVAATEYTLDDEGNLRVVVPPPPPPPAATAPSPVPAFSPPPLAPGGASSFTRGGTVSGGYPAPPSPPPPPVPALGAGFAASTRPASPTSAANGRPKAGVATVTMQVSPDRTTTKTVALQNELAELREENKMLRDIERQFWLVLDEREQLAAQVRQLERAVDASTVATSSVVAAKRIAAMTWAAAGGVMSDGARGGLGYDASARPISTALPAPATSGAATETLQKENNQLRRLLEDAARALDESLGLLLIRDYETTTAAGGLRDGAGDHNAASMADGSAAAAALSEGSSTGERADVANPFATIRHVVPGSLIERFLLWCRQRYAQPDEVGRGLGIAASPADTDGDALDEREAAVSRPHRSGGAATTPTNRATVTFRGVADASSALSPSRAGAGGARGVKTGALASKIAAQKGGAVAAAVTKPTTSEEGDWLAQQQAELASHLESLGLNGILGDLESTRGHQHQHLPSYSHSHEQQQGHHQRAGPTLLPLAESAPPAAAYSTGPTPTHQGHSAQVGGGGGGGSGEPGGSGTLGGAVTPQQQQQYGTSTHMPYGAVASTPRGGTSSGRAATGTAAGGGGGGDLIIGASMAQLQQQVASLSMQLRMAQGENSEMQLELDRCDASRLQALEDAERLQHQVTMLSENISELRHAALEARQVAAAAAPATAQLQAARAELAEREAEVAHLKGRVAELQRATSQLPESQLAADAARIRAELAARMGGGGGGGGAAGSQTPPPPGSNATPPPRA